MDVSIVRARSELELEQVRALMRAFVHWHRASHQQDVELIDRYFDPAAFETELAALPAKYAPPAGELLLAHCGGEPAGCVALTRIDGERCEMKRLFVETRFHGMGLGRALSEAIVDEARRLGYRTMLLDTSFRQLAAQKLYRDMGFEVVEPYYDLPQELRDWLVFMRLEL